MDEKEAEARPVMGTIFLVVVSFSVCLSVLLSVCQNKIWELTHLELRTKREKTLLYSL